MTRDERRKRPEGPKVRIHVAGSCLSKTSMAAGWAAKINNTPEKTVDFISGSLPGNPEMSAVRAEMVAVAKALEALPDGCNVTLWTIGEHIPKSLRYGWTRTKHLDVWQAIDAQILRHSIKWRDSQLFYKKKDTVEVHDLAHAEAIKEEEAATHGEP